MTGFVSMIVQCFMLGALWVIVDKLTIIASHMK